MAAIVYDIAALARATRAGTPALHISAPTPPNIPAPPAKAPARRPQGSPPPPRSAACETAACAFYAERSAARRSRPPRRQAARAKADTLREGVAVPEAHVLYPCRK